MNRQVICEKDYVSVLPRIIDPKMQFTKESIENTFDNKKIQDLHAPINKLKIQHENRNKIDTHGNVSLNNSEESDNDVNNSSNGYIKGVSFISDYKYVIIVIIIAITIIIIYLIYRYYSKETSKETQQLDNTQPLAIDNEKSKEKKENVKSYLASYIQDEEVKDGDSEDDEDIIELDENNSISSHSSILNNNSITPVRCEGQMPVLGATIIISEFEIPMNNINASKVEEFVEMIPNKNKQIYNYVKDNNHTPIMEIIDITMKNTNTHIPIMEITESDDIDEINVNDNKQIVDAIMDHSSKNIQSEEEEDYNSLFDDCDGITNNSISDIHNYDNIFKTNEVLTTSEEKTMKKNNISQTKKDSKLNCGISKPIKLNSEDDIKYFQKFNKTT